MSKKIYLSPSNQNGNMYAYGNTNEMEQCNKFADYAKVALERCGFEVKKAPKGQNMNVSINESNAWGADMHIPIHTNAMSNTGTGTAGGTVVFVYNTNSPTATLAKPIYKEVQAVSPGKTEYGIQAYPKLAELCKTNAHAVYIEVDFHDNPPIAKWLVENPKAVGEAICKGVCEAYGVEYIDDKPKPVSVFYRVQVGAFSQKENAETCLNQLKEAGFKDAYIVEVKK